MPGTIRERALTKMAELQKLGDPEEAHPKADEVLCELLIFLDYEDVVNEWRKILKWYA